MANFVQICLLLGSAGLAVLNMDTRTRSILSSSKSTLEDVLQFRKCELVAYLRAEKLKITGSKQELARRIHTIHESGVNSADIVSIDSGSTGNYFSPDVVPAITELSTGWTSDVSQIPKIAVTDIETYLIHSSHRTDDSLKMECYRQYIRGLNFSKEKYIHKVMVNTISNSVQLCYVRSKCHPSMKQGTYQQWTLLTKASPVTVVKANCTCPAGLGEGCSHIAGLLFTLEDISGTNSTNELACTSKPCEWNKPLKRKKEAKPVEEITFKRIKLYNTEDHEKKPTGNKNKKVLSEAELCQFKTKLCGKLGNQSNAVLFHLLAPSVNDTSIPVESDLNVCEEVVILTSEAKHYPSDPYINIIETIKQNDLSTSNILDFFSKCDSVVVEELESRTRGQQENPLWVTSRKGRLTASIFHDVKTRKDTTPSQKLVNKILGDATSEDNTSNIPALKWGRKMEAIAKKHYKAIKKLKFKQNITILEKGLFLHKDSAYLGASPDGVVVTKSDEYLIEVKCPYKWRYRSVTDACKNADFCCYIDENNEIQLKQNNRYYTQVQGQMGICGIHMCELVIYTTKDLKIVSVPFDNLFWNELKEKLVHFYTEHVIPCLVHPV